MSIELPGTWSDILQGLLTSLKIDIGITTSAYDTRLLQMLKSAFRHISIEGITLDDGDDVDKDLVVMYARWLWRKRDSGEGMPRMLRYALNNRLISEKMRGDDGG